MPMAANKSPFTAGAGVASIVFGMMGKLLTGLIKDSGAGVKGISVMCPSSASFESSAVASLLAFVLVKSGVLAWVGSGVIALVKSSAVPESDVWVGVDSVAFALNKSAAVPESSNLAGVDSAAFALNKSAAVVESSILAGVDSAAFEPNKSSAVVTTLFSVLKPPDDTADPWVAVAGETKSGLSNLVDAPGVPLF